MLTNEQYLEAILERVCPKCVDGDGKGNCRISNNAECAVKRFHSEIVEVVRSMYSNSMAPYEAALRNKVCGACIHQSSDGRCAVRNEVDCSLDRYFPLIVETIEKLEVKHRLTSPGTGWSFE